MILQTLEQVTAKHLPDEKILEGIDYRKYGSVLIGERGKLFFDRFRDTWMVKPSSAMDGFECPEPSIPRARDDDNYKDPN